MSIAVCPTCSAKANVIDSRANGQYCRRRYRCKSGHRYSTIEIPATDEFSLQRLTNAIANINIMESLADQLRAIARQMESRSAPGPSREQESTMAKGKAPPPRPAPKAPPGKPMPKKPY